MSLLKIAVDLNRIVTVNREHTDIHKNCRFGSGPLMKIKTDVSELIQTYIYTDRHTDRQTNRHNGKYILDNGLIFQMDRNDRERLPAPKRRYKVTFVSDQRRVF